MIVDDLFFVLSGKGGYRENLNRGKTPLVSATNKNNGILAFVDIDPTFTAPSITVERVTGQAFVQVDDFVTVPDDISVLVPKEPMPLKKLFYVASQINSVKWKFSYGRKLTQTRLKNIKLDLSNFKEGTIDLLERLPQKIARSQIKNSKNYKEFNITALFEIERGDFHALDKLNEGELPTISRITYDNGVAGHYEKPNDAEIYPAGTITVSTLESDAFVQLENFIATDNVLILKPKRDFKLTTLFFVQFMINSQKWRFSYGRESYKTLFSKVNIPLPVKIIKGKNKVVSEIDEDFIEKLVKNCYGYELIEEKIESDLVNLFSELHHIEA